MTLREGAKFLRRIKQRIPTELSKALNETSREAFRLAQKYSSGTFVAGSGGPKDPLWMRVAHPYARSGEGTGLNHPHPEIINVQTGELLASWHRQGPTRVDVWATKTMGAGNLSASVYNTAPHAVFMGGTTLMVPRPIMARVKAEIAGSFARNCEAALRRAIQVK